MNTKTVLITGASRGIGRAAALVFAKAGYRLVLNCRQNTPLLESLCEEITSTFHTPCLPFTGDVSDYETCRRMFAAAEDTFGGVDILINNAGISYVGLLSDMTPEQWDTQLATNLSAVFYCCKLAIPHMLSNKEGKILNVSSVWGCVGASCEAAYSASKGGVNVLTQALAKELAPSNIQVNALACGLIDTEMNEHLSAEEKRALYEEIPAGRAATPTEVAEMLLTLAQSPSYLTGQVIRFDGGWI